MTSLVDWHGSVVKIDFVNMMKVIIHIFLNLYKNTVHQILILLNYVEDYLIKLYLLDNINSLWSSCSNFNKSQQNTC